LKDFSDQVFAKVILCGEHSVLRGGRAVVTPLKSHSLKFEINKNFDCFKLSYSDEVKPFEILIEGTFEKAFELLEVSKNHIKSTIHIESLVPLGKGFGGSAALCVFVARSVKELGLLTERSVFSFSVELENMFHGESSGVDIAGCLSESPQVYVRGKVLKPLESNLKGLVFGLTDTGENGDTEDCIEKVLRLKSRDQDLFYSLDGEMDEASKLLGEAIELGNQTLLAQSFAQASDVFKSWGLITEEMQKVSVALKKQGALATKPTGSGLGGCVLSVWREEDIKSAKLNCMDIFTI